MQAPSLTRRIAAFSACASGDRKSNRCTNEGPAFAIRGLCRSAEVATDRGVAASAAQVQASKETAGKLISEASGFVADQVRVKSIVRVDFTKRLATLHR